MSNKTEELSLRLHQDAACRPQEVKVELNLPHGDFCVTILASGRSSLPDLVPLARALSDAVAARTAASAAAQGLHVPCRNSCGACCRYAVPVSVPEALRIGYELSFLRGSQSHHVQRAMLSAAGKVLSAAPTLAASGTREFSTVYQSLDLACPLASGSSCRFYAWRPLACREHLVTCQGSGQAGGCPGTNVLSPPVSVLEGLAELAAQVEGRSVESVLLPLTLPWLEENRRRAQRTWYAADLARSFGDILERRLTSKQNVA